VLNKGGLGTLLFDLLTTDEEGIDDITGELRFNIPFLSDRLVGVTDWLKQATETASMDLGYFGASTGSAVAIVAAVRKPGAVKAIVSRGGRPDLAEEDLQLVKAPVMLIVGGDDYEVIKLNKAAFSRIKAEKEMVIVPGATHLFEEAGTLEKVASLAKDWFAKYLRK
jgi:putative phosphoribosyl transferase